MTKSYATYVCTAPPLCAPCGLGKHDDCGWDGEPDCLCADHPIPMRTFRGPVVGIHV